MPIKGTKIKFYSESDKNYLADAINGKIKLTESFLDKASKKLNRSKLSIRQYVYTRRKTTQSKSSFRQGEFVIPIDKWEIKTVDGVNHLVFKFGIK